MENQGGFPYYFNSKACKTCGGNCCRGFGGYVWISMEEIEIMAAAKEMEVAPFSIQYVRRVQGRLSLKERILNGEHFCCFFDFIDCRCTIYKSRPKQCRTFPFWDQFKKEPQALFAECPGVSYGER
jgi:uncharacterized protein